MGLDPVEVHGRFFKRGDERFLVRGVVYQRPDYTRPQDLINDDELPRLRHDVELFRELGVNTILVYFIDNTKPRDQAMKLLEEAGIYVLFTILTPTVTIRRNDPYNSYNSTTMASFFRSIDAMSQFTNTLGGFAAYDLINNQQSLVCAPVVKAVIRDVKRYMMIKHKTVGQRILPVGYGGSFVDANGKHRAVLKYLASGDSANRIDFGACKCFSSGGKSSIEPSKFNDLIHQYHNSNIPIFISEYSADGWMPEPRDFEDIKTLFSPDILKVLSGCCVYEMWQGGNRYGIVQMVTPDGREIPGKTVRGRRETEFGELVVYEDFENYRGALDATKDVQGGEDGSVVGGREEEGAGEMLEIDGVVPDSCVDWNAV